MNIPALPCLRFESKTLKPMHSLYPEYPKTIGDHIRKKRMDLKLLQKDVSKIFKVSEDSITFWENNRNEPQIKYYPRIIKFLGYYPFDLDLTTFMGRLKAYRYVNGLSQMHFATLMNIDPATVKRWETGLGKGVKMIGMERLLANYDFKIDSNSIKDIIA